MVNLILENKISLPLKRDELEEVFNQSLAKLEIGDKINIELIFVDKSEIANLNKEFRQKDTPTDVLSFPQEQFDVEENILGSIVICPDIAKEKNEEINQLLKHGLLHLLGFDHEEDEVKWDEMAQKIGCSY